MVTKNNLFYLINGSIFIFAFLVFWLELTFLYQDPHVILSLEPQALLKIIYIALTLAAINIPIALLITVRTDLKKRYLLYLLAAASATIYFLHKPLITFLLALGTIIALHHFDSHSRRELENQLKFKPYSVFRRGISGFVTTMALIISIAYYSFSVALIGDFKLIIPAKIFDNLISAVGDQFQQNNDSVDLTTATEMVFEGEVKPQILEQLAQANITDPAQIDKYLAAAKQDLDQKAKQELDKLQQTGNKNFLTQVKVQAQDNINTLIDRYRHLLPAIFSFSLFAAFQFLDPIVSLIVSAVLFFIVKLLKSSRVVHTRKQEQTIERLSL